MKNNVIETKVRFLKGVGPARAEALKKLGIFTVGDLIEYYPRNYEDRSIVKNICDITEGESVTVKAFIKTIDLRRIRKNLNILKVLAGDETGTISIVWFNQDYYRSKFNSGDLFYFYGKIRKNLILEMHNPIFSSDYSSFARIQPVYKKNKDVSQNLLRKSIKASLEMTSENIIEFIPKRILAEYNLVVLANAIKNIHFPESDKDFLKARRRLVFQEFFMLQSALLLIKKNIMKKASVKEKILDFSLGDKYISQLKFELTNAQKRVISEIRNDFSSGKPMSRLVQGDVGSGKTAVAATIIADICKNKMQSAFMAPTEILATQHYQNLKSTMDTMGIKTVLLTGSIKGKKRIAILDEIHSGSAKLIIGTHALIQDDIDFYSLGLVITDEQHRFGVEQRAVLGNKGNSPHSLVLTATPIPRTLALILYGDLDISVIDEMPPGRKIIETYYINESKRRRVLDFAEKRMKEGSQVYYVCPRIDDSGDTDGLVSVQKIYEELKNYYRNYNVAVMHGKLKSSEKEELMNKFYNGEINLLVSTTVIEVGVDAPNATLMIIDNAERFGLAQLHQLRGRVGRGERQSYCILINRSTNPIAARRMKVMEDSTDGFIISDEDLKLRGPGEFFGTRQHGLPEFKIANIYTDMDLLKQAQKAAINLLGDENGLHMDENKPIIKKINKMINGFGSL